MSISRSASPSERVRRATWARRTALAFGTLVVVGAAGQPSTDVTGRLRIVNRPGDDAQELTDAVVWLETVRRSATTAPPASDVTPSGGSILMKGREFLPHVRVVRSGGAVAFPNDDPFSHNVFSNTSFGAFDLGLYRHGDTRAASFERTGVYPIYCNIHHRMVSFVVAVPTPWSAQPAADGRFTLRDVPAGSYVLHVWHKSAGETRRPLVVEAGAAPLQLTLDARGYVPAAHLNKFGVPYTATRADRY